MDYFEGYTSVKGTQERLWPVGTNQSGSTQEKGEKPQDEGE